MNRLLLSIALAAGAACTSGAAMAQSNLGVTIGIQQPGVYGQITLGNPPPPPALIVTRPVIVTPGPVAVAPLYLYVPPGHQRHWHQHCHRYNACGRPVYFVRESWVRERYAQEHPGWRPGHEGRGDRGQERGSERGRGEGRGQGHGRHDG